MKSECQFVSLGGANTAHKDNLKDIGVASALKLNNIFPINLTYKHGKGVNSISGKLGPLNDKYNVGKIGAFEPRLSNPTILEF